MIGISGVVRDERTVVVEDASYRFAYLFITFALLLDVMYRSLVRREASWELLAIVLLGGAISTLYQWRHQILTRHSAKLALFTGGLAGIVAALIAASRLLR
jgi:hypothetical protein